MNIRRQFQIAATMIVCTLSAQAQFRTVTVQNAANNPVPVQQQGTVGVTGNVSVTNTPTITGSVTVNNGGSAPVPTTIQNTPSVTATNLPTTNNGATANGAVAVKSVDEPGRQPFIFQASCGLGGSNFCTATVPVPAGKELVIQYVNFFGTSTPASYYELRVQSSGLLPIFVFTPGPNTSFFQSVTNAQVSLYSDPSSTVSCIAFATVTTGNFYCNVAGYLVNVP